MKTLGEGRKESIQWRHSFPVYLLPLLPSPTPLLPIPNTSPSHPNSSPSLPTSPPSFPNSSPSLCPIPHLRRIPHSERLNILRTQSRRIWGVFNPRARQVPFLMPLDKARQRGIFETEPPGWYQLCGRCGLSSSLRFCPRQDYRGDSYAYIHTHVNSIYRQTDEKNRIARQSYIKQINKHTQTHK